jgi:hypothetical protein
MPDEVEAAAGSTGEGGASPARAEQLTVSSRGRHLWPSVRWAEWARLFQATRTIDLHQEQDDHGLRNARVATISAIAVGALVGASEWLVYGQTVSHRYQFMAGPIGAFMLTPLIISVYLSLCELTIRLLRSLRQDGVISWPAAGKRLDDFARSTSARLNRPAVCAFSAVVAITYFAYRVKAYWVIPEREDTMTLLLTKILIVTSSVVLAAVVYLGFVALIRLWIVSRAIGAIMREFPIHIQPLHPDGCGGLWVVGHMLRLTLYIAAILAGVGLSLIIGWRETPIPPIHRPEPYVLIGVYLLLFPSAFVNLLWLPHRIMEKNRDLTLKPVARVFDAKIKAMRPSETDDAQQLKAKADSLAETKRQLELLDEACPIWPLHTKRLRIVLVTAVLPVVVPIVTAIIDHLLDR